MVKPKQQYKYWIKSFIQEKDFFKVPNKKLKEELSQLYHHFQQIHYNVFADTDFEFVPFYINQGYGHKKKQYYLDNNSHYSKKLHRFCSYFVPTKSYFYLSRYISFNKLIGFYLLQKKIFFQLNFKNFKIYFFSFNIKMDFL